GGQLPAEFAQHLMQDTVRDALGVHEDAIAVEQNRGELRVRSHGPILPSATDAGSHRPDRHRTGPTDIAPARPTSHRPDRHRTCPTDIAPARPTKHRPDRHRTGPTGIAPVRSTDRTAVPTAGLTPARSSPPSTGRAPRRARRR